ncbi:mfs general substrate transporter [Venturia nashicola]|uniref:Mfs general substrate transporter n=1 Tax=Venturia nashicola TaxID=86259 RepID=A0A4Z1NR47_9PEZI|nr:mfs general substrate transporter [Venturia nashicola]TLD15027.1 mfs general substrate transporter [Venturia nashicola]
MAPHEPPVPVEKLVSVSASVLSDDSTHFVKSNEKRHSTQTHSSSGSEDTDGTDHHLSTRHNVYNDGESLAEVKSITRMESRHPNFEIDFEEGDAADPHNWPFWYRSAVLFFVSYSTLTVIMYSTSYTSGIPGILLTFHIQEQTLAILGITTYMLGLALGSVVLAPLSEMYGRRPIYLVAIVLFGILSIPCALAPNLEAILVSRFFGAIAGSAMITNAPGTVNDIVLEKHRALAFSIWSIGPMNGPVIGPLIGGFVYQHLGWRWTNWIVIISTGVSSVFLLLVQETYAPTILRKMAAKKRKETEDGRWWCRYDEKRELWPLLKLNLSRPFVMTVTEPICLFWDIYIALVYAVLYLCFVAYPIVFAQGRGWAPGISGLGFFGIGLGSLIVIGLEPAIRKMINSHTKDAETGAVPPEAMVSVVCIAAVCVPVGELIFAWTCTPNVHWIVPILAGVPFGAGNCAVFIYSSNYLVHSYGIYAASALAGNAVLRSVLGGTLPLAGPSLYRALGPNWAGTLLAALEFAMVPIPFVFYRYGHKIRMKSKLIRAMQEDKDRLAAKKKEAERNLSV